MPELDIRRKYTYGRKKKGRRKENFAASLVSGLLPWFGDTVSDVVRKIVFLASLIALAVSVLVIANFYLGPKEEGTSAFDWVVDHSLDDRVRISISADKGGDLSGGGETKEVEILEKYLEFYEINNDFVGYVSIDPYINYPVAQSGDNEYYLYHNFRKVPTENGTVFADYEGVFTPTSRPHNTILYGHNLITKNLFQPLVNYRDKFEFLKNNPVVNFDTLYEKGTYKIFSVFLSNTKDYHGEVFKYWNYVYFHSKSEFYDFVTECLDRSYYQTGTDIKYGDEFLTLSTCDFSAFDGLRLVIVARRVREGEPPFVDTERFFDNKGFDENGKYKRKMFDVYYTVFNSGKGWAGRNWDVSLVEGLKEYLSEKEG
ncbi:MAG: class B sortase [Oscillospiraceae bacterium]|jgi:sortase B|nr:class B sortase [Oscillospiraceae bacterium]